MTERLSRRSKRGGGGGGGGKAEPTYVRKVSHIFRRLGGERRGR